MLILFLTRSWRLHRSGHNCNGFRERPCCLPKKNTFFWGGALLGKMAQGTFCHPRFPCWLWLQTIDPQKRFRKSCQGILRDPAGHWGSLYITGGSMQFPTWSSYFDPIDINSLDPAISTSCSEPFVETVRGSLGHCRRLNGSGTWVHPQVVLKWKETCRRRNMGSFKILVTWWFYEISRD